MVYISIDIETTGLDPFTDQILSVAMVVEDSKRKVPLCDLPKVHYYLTHEKITGSVAAISMNTHIISTINQYNSLPFQQKQEFADSLDIKFIGQNELHHKMSKFICNHVYGWENLPDELTVNVAGKNFGSFDRLFLENVFNQKESLKPLFPVKFRHRNIDPTTLYIDWDTDITPPGLDVCKHRSGADGKYEHDALKDAYDVIELLRKHY